MRPDIGPVLFTRMCEEQYDAASNRTDAKLDYDPLSQTAFLNGCLAERDARVGIVAAGTSDRSVALEAQRTLQFLGIGTRCTSTLASRGCGAYSTGSTSSAPSRC